MISNRDKVEVLRTIRVILENGDRLAKDAEYLWEMDRFPSAFALCILAQEEYAKAFLLHFVYVEAIPWGADIQRTLRDHASKQLLDPKRLIIIYDTENTFLSIDYVYI